MKDKDKNIKKLKKEVKRLCRDCAEAYQALGAAMLGDDQDCVAYRDDDVVCLLDNLSAAACGHKRPHNDLLPWPKDTKLTDIDLTDLRKKIQLEPRFARTLLRQAGIVDKDGKLTKECGG